MPELDFESDFLQLLTEALRAGPGSPEWHRAVTQLDGDASDQTTEYQLLIAARQRLESGREYRSIRAGSAFTRRVMESLDQQPDAAPANITTGGVIAGLSVLLIALAAIAIGYLIFRNQPSADPAIDALANSYFSKSLVDVTFADGVPDGWREIGRLSIDTARGFRLKRQQAEQSASGGGIYWSQPLTSDQKYEIQVSLHLSKPGSGGPGVIAQVFVTDDPTFDEDRGTSPHELVWLVQDAESKLVVPGGRVETQSSPLGNRRVGNLNLRILLDQSVAVIEQNGRPFWSGRHGLGSSSPRYVGIRFLQPQGAGGKSDTEITFTSLAIQTP
jgi:hypothetical protein